MNLSDLFKTYDFHDSLLIELLQISKSCVKITLEICENEKNKKCEIIFNNVFYYHVESNDNLFENELISSEILSDDIESFKGVFLDDNGNCNVVYINSESIDYRVYTGNK